MHNSKIKSKRKNKMSLNIGGGSGDYKSFVKFDAKNNKWKTKKDGVEVEIQNPVFVMDWSSLKTGWFLFLDGKAPSIAIDPSLESMAAQPSPEHKRGFDIDVYSQANFGGVVNWTSTSAIVGKAIKELYTEYLSNPEGKAGKFPVVEATGAEPQKGKFGTNYKPILKVQKYVDKPEAFNAAGVTPIIPEPVVVKKAVNEF